MRFASCLVVLLAGADLARADDLAPPRDNGPALTAHANDSMMFGLAVNPPLRWRNAVAASAYVGFAKQHAIRLNVATFAYDDVFGDLMAIPAGGDGASRDGRTSDISLGWQYYSHGWFRGFTFEAGVLRRGVDTTEHDDVSNQTRAVDAAGYGGRVLFGWTWLVARHAFFATGVGMSVGRYSGIETTMPDDNPQAMRERFTRFEAHGELFMRLGVAL